MAILTTGPRANPQQLPDGRIVQINPGVILAKMGPMIQVSINIFQQIANVAPASCVGSV